MKHLFLALLFTMVSCASMKETVNGYSGSEKSKKLALIKGKTPNEVKEIMGTPVAEGFCQDSCGKPEGMYQFVYLNKPLPRYSYALTMANKSELGCFIVYFYYDQELQKHVYHGPGVMDQVSCAQDYGAIVSTNKMRD